MNHIILMKNCSRPKVFLTHIFYVSEFEIGGSKIFLRGFFQKNKGLLVVELYVYTSFPSWIVRFLRVDIYLSFPNAKHNKLYRIRGWFIQNKYIEKFLSFLNIMLSAFYLNYRVSPLIIKAIKTDMKPHFLLKLLTLKGKTVD